MQEELDSPEDLSVPWALPAGPAGVTLARHATRRYLSSLGIGSDFVDTAELLVSELTANVVKHTGGQSTLRIMRNDDVLRIEVGDSRPSQLPVERDVDLDAQSGRGLILVSTLADSWGYERDGNQKITWVELDVPH